MSSTKKGNDWYFGMKAHVGVDVDNGTVHSLEATNAKVPDSPVWDELLHGKENSVWADKGYISAERETAFSTEGKLDPIDQEINRIIAKVRAKVEHPFSVIKRQFDHVKTCYRGQPKTGAPFHSVRAWQPVPRATRAACIRMSLSEICIGAAEYVNQTFLNQLERGWQNFTIW